MRGRVSINIGAPRLRPDPLLTRADSWLSYWKKQTDTLLFFGQTTNITGGRLYNEMNGSSDYLTVGGSAGSYTFQ